MAAATAAAAPAIVASVPNTSGVTVLLHPLVIVNVSDHYIRRRAQANPPEPNPMVVGALLGQHNGRTIDVSNSFELVIQPTGQLDREFFLAKQTQFRQVFPTLDFLGWYATSAAVTEDHVRLHNQMVEFNESPLFLRIDPAAAPVAKELPITVYESFIDGTQTPPRMIFIEGTFKLETGDSERIAVDHVTNASQVASGGSSARVTSFLQNQRSALEALRSRIKVLLDYLVDVQNGTVPADPELLRAVSAVCHRLPLLETDALREERAREETEALLLTYLSSITQANDRLHELVDKFLSSQERHGRRGRAVF